MCYAGACNPECDNCKPKYLDCPQCGTRLFLGHKTCPSCGYAPTDDDRAHARELWKLTHVGK